jgi:hypothetical protein
MDRATELESAFSLSTSYHLPGSRLMPLMCKRPSPVWAILWATVLPKEDTGSERLDHLPKVQV